MNYESDIEKSACDLKKTMVGTGKRYLKHEPYRFVANWAGVTVVDMFPEAFIMNCMRAL
jgi:hypothetical protein